MSADLFREIADRLGESEPDAWAAAICADLKLSARQREALYRLVLAECELMRRARVRQIEQSTPRIGTAADTTAARSALLAETFALGDGRRVSWGDATVADHEARVALLAKLRDGIDATIARHLAAIDAIVSARVTCLADLDSVAVAA